MFNHREYLLWVLLFSMVAWYFVPPAWIYKPYENVEVVYVERLPDGYVRVAANFTKLDCEFLRLEVVKGSLGTTELARWRPVDTDTKDYDRSIGEHTLVIDIDLGGIEPTFIEIRTRHACDGQLVDRVFAKFVLPDAPEQRLIK